MDDHRRRFWSGAAEAPGRYLEESGIARLLICGSTEAAHAVGDLLPWKAKDAVVEQVVRAIHRWADRWIPVAARSTR